MDMAFCLHRESVSAVSDRATQPAGFMLYQNMPNPFSPITVIQYDVPHEGAEISIRVYDVKGRHISTIADGKQSLGRQMASWDGRDEKGQDIASGIYFYRMKAPGFEMTRKVVILR
jgi:rare lipoprotein A (peptidoglycan hydrolase)